MGKGAGPTVGYWYLTAFHVGLGVGPIDAYLEFRGGDKTAWAGQLTASGTIQINAPRLWGGEKDQGGIVGDVDVMFGEADQLPNPYLTATFGDQQPAWRGLTTLVFKGGKYGAMSPYPQPASHKICKILQGWDDDTCWYPEKAVVDIQVIPAGKQNWRYKVVEVDDETDYSATGFADAAWAVGPAPFGDKPYPEDFSGAPHHYGFSDSPATIVAVEKAVWMRSTFSLVEVPPGGLAFDAFVDNGIKVWINGQLVIDNFTPLAHPVVTTIGAEYLVQGQNYIAVRGTDMSPPPDPFTNWFYFDVRLQSEQLFQTMNPAHVLYYARTHREIGREPIANMSDASYRAAADKLHGEGFGICPEYDPSAESLIEFEQRICNLIGGSVNRSLEDGLYYLDLARGDYAIEDLPILTDDDVLSFSEQPSILDNAINSVSVRYFDPQRKETMVTPPVQALALIDAFGTNHQVKDYPEIPTAELAARIAERDLRVTVTPTRAFDLDTKRTPLNWRPNTYFRAQMPKRGIGDMVCLLGTKETGTLKSGAIRIAAAQDIYSLPSTSYVEVEHGVDTRPPQTPVAITLEHVFEAPYAEVVANLTRADLAVLPPETGYALAVAADPGQNRDYTMVVAADGSEFVEAGSGDWCPTALVVEAAGITDTAFTLSGASRLGEVLEGSAVLFGDEICRVDAIDSSTLSVTLGRGCVDTVPVAHPAGTRLWFFADHVAIDPTEYTDGETIDVKLLSNTGSQQLAEGLATAMELTFDQRQFRPYPPGLVRVNDAAAPAYLFGEVTVTWAHRDRVLQADQLVDHEMASTGPEAGTTYTVRWYLDDVLVQTHSAIAGTSQAYTPAGDGLLRIELESERDGLTSWQMHVREVTYTVAEIELIEFESGELAQFEDDEYIEWE